MSRYTARQRAALTALYGTGEAQDDAIRAAQVLSYRPVKKTRQCASEESEQAAIIAWMDVAWPMYARWLHHSPNGGYRGVREADRLKSAGVRPGWPDLVLPLARTPYCGLAIELKALDGRPPSEAQFAWLGWLQEQCWYAIWVRGATDACAEIDRYIRGDAP